MWRSVPHSPTYATRTWTCTADGRVGSARSTPTVRFPRYAAVSTACLLGVCGGASRSGHDPMSQYTRGLIKGHTYDLLPLAAPGELRASGFSKEEGTGHMTTQHRRAVMTRPRQVLLTTAVAASLVALTACSASTSTSTDSGSSTSGSSSASGTSYGFDTAKQDPTAKITVWVDASRQPAADAFVKAHPEIPVNVETYDGGADGSGSFQTKIEPFDQAGSGWPDVVFSTQNNDAAWASQEQRRQPFAPLLNKGYPRAVLPRRLHHRRARPARPSTARSTACATTWRRSCSGTTRRCWTSSATPCRPPGRSTRRSATSSPTEHPGYFLGARRRRLRTPEVYFWGGKAPTNQVTGDTFSSTPTRPSASASRWRCSIDLLAKKAS